MNTKGLRLVAAAALAVGGIGITGCERDDDTTARVQTTTPSGDPGPSASVTVDGDKVDSAADKTGNALEDVGEDLKDGAQKAGSAIKSGAQKTGDVLKSGAQKAGNALDRGLDRTGDAVRGDGTADTDAGAATGPDAAEAGEVVAEVANAALTTGGLDDLVERLSKADRDRIGDAAGQKFDDLDGKIDQLNKAWQDKYGKGFKDVEPSAAFPANALSVTAGGGAQPAAVDVNVDVDRTADGAAAKVDVDQAGGRAATASVTLVGGADLPKMAVPLVHEHPDVWRIDVPDTMTGQMLKDNLLKHLNMIDPAQLPADANEAYRQVTHHVLMAVTGMDK